LHPVYVNLFVARHFIVTEKVSRTGGYLITGNRKIKKYVGDGYGTVLQPSPYPLGFLTDKGVDMEFMI